MRVIHILDHSLPLRSDYALRTIAMLEEQRAMGWETFHLTGPRQGPSAAEEEVDGWLFHRTPPPGGILEGVPLLAECELVGEITYRVEQLAKRLRPHILHAHSPVLNAIPALRVGSRLGIPVVYELHALGDDVAGTGSLRRRLMHWLETWVLRRADAVTTLSEALRRDTLARGVRAERVTLIPGAPAMGCYEDVYSRIQEPSWRT